MADRSKLQRRLEALQSAASLPPLSLACVHVADAILLEVAAEIAEGCQREAGGAISCNVEVQRLLEGMVPAKASGTETVSAPLHALLEEEVAATAKFAQEARETFAPALSAGSGADIFGNRPKQPSVETIICTNCGTALSTNRFAPHLERCMLGKGRASARQAREAMQNTL